VTSHLETSDSAALGRRLEDDELDERRVPQDEDERRPSLAVRPTPRDPVTGKT
jgi:hypothetical protein